MQGRKGGRVEDSGERVGDITFTVHERQIYYQEHCYSNMIPCIFRVLESALQRDRVLMEFN